MKILEPILEKKILIIRGKNGLENLKNQLTLAGAQVDYLEVYERVQSDDLNPITSFINMKESKIFLISSQFEAESLLPLFMLSFDFKKNWIILPSNRVAKIFPKEYIKNIVIINPSNTDTLRVTIESILKENECLNH